MVRSATISLEEVLLFFWKRRSGIGSAPGELETERIAVGVRTHFAVGVDRCNHIKLRYGARAEQAGGKTGIIARQQPMDARY